MVRTKDLDNPDCLERLLDEKSNAGWDKRCNCGYGHLDVRQTIQWGQWYQAHDLEILASEALPHQYRRKATTNIRVTVPHGRGK
jgi:hypothetical protein